MGKNAHGPRSGNASKKSSSSKQEDVATGSSDKSKSKKSNGLAWYETPPDETTKGKGKGKKEVDAVAEEGPKKPTARQLVGGTSWTGKLPMNLLSELCQKQKWDKPDYPIRQSAAGFTSFVVLKSKNPKTGEVTQLPPFRIPKEKEEAGLGVQPSAIEARHFAAAYALYRVANMKNMHMMLPPSYRDLWKGEFEQMKIEDTAAGKGWMYEADPFAAAKAREESKAQKEKDREKKAKIAAAAKEIAIPGLDPEDRGSPTKGWANAPRVELGKRLRREIESTARKHSVWNVHDLDITGSARSSIVDKLATAGFRRSHAEEAMRYCKDREEALEWLLIYVPEDDLPKWALPENYSAGVSIASGDIARDAAIRRLSLSGYPLEDCEEAFDLVKGVESKAAQLLQDRLLGQTDESDETSRLAALSVDSHDSEAISVWNEEMDVLHSIFNERYKRISKGSCIIKIDMSKGKEPISITLQQPSGDYPNVVPVLRIQAALPAYIRLTILRKCLDNAKNNYLGDQMCFNIIDWLENEVERLIENPDELYQLVPTVESANGSARIGPPQNKRRQKNIMRSSQSDEHNARLAVEWQTRQSTAQQQKMNKVRESLPAWQVRNDLCKAVKDHRVVIVSGETGSGKSTQTVQFILDEMIASNKGGVTKIICTQPRRISALGLADRVAEERCGSVGQEVGYSIRGESKQGPQTRITFVTTGVLLRRMQSNGGDVDSLVESIADLSHIVIDEVHERSLDTDLLLALVKNVLQVRTDLKVILMSATLDAQVFESYFGRFIGKQNVGKIHISGRTHPVEDFYLDDVLRLTQFSHISDRLQADPEDQRKDMSKAIQSIGMGINYDLIANLVESIDIELGSQDGSILMFLPGTMEINRAMEALRKNGELHVLPLHASLLPAEQRRVFPPPPRGKRKVIASTNVAETSITIPDVVAVIDTGRVKETRYDPVNSMSRLEEVWASRAACKQRRGRAGRVREGVCYKLFTRDAEAKMAENPEPEMRRVPLEQLCLNVRGMGIPDVQNFLTTSTLTPPDSLAVDGAMKLLRRIGALDGENLTALGEHLATIPADLRCAKLMIYGALFGCLDACVTIASVLTIKSPFVSPSDKRDQAKAARESFSLNTEGDIIADMRAYHGWADRRKNSSTGDVRRWCDQTFLSWNTLNDIMTTRTQYITSLQDVGFLPRQAIATGTTTSAHYNRNEQSTRLIEALLLSALHPQTLRIALPSQKYTSTMTGTFAMDPESRAIKYFDETNTRVFVHPGSTLFSAQSFGNAHFLSYFTRAQTSKIFVRELTPAGCYAMLLFGGAIEIDTAGRGLSVDGWVRIRGWARIGVLISRLRGLLDAVLHRWFEEPAGQGGSETARQMESEVVDIVRRLVELEGLDN